MIETSYFAPGCFWGSGASGRRRGWWRQASAPWAGARRRLPTGKRYRSANYYVGDSQREAAESTAALYGAAIAAEGHGAITTQITSGAGHINKVGHMARCTND